MSSKISDLIEDFKLLIDDVGDRVVTKLEMSLEDDVSFFSRESKKGEENAEHNTETGESKTH